MSAVRVLHSSGRGCVEAMSGPAAMAATIGATGGLHIKRNVSNCKTWGTRMEVERGNQRDVV
jgi:hypothetical protein